MSDIVKFKAIFNGLESAYGTYTIESEREDTKQVGKGFVVREVPTDIIWQKHLDGKEPSLGIIPIRSDQTCVWGAFDIDEYNLDHKNLVGKIKKMNLIGAPYQIIIGKKSEGDLLEFKEIGSETQNLPLSNIIEIITKQKNSI